MDSSKPFLVLAAVVGIAVLAAVVLSRLDTTPEVDREKIVVPVPLPTAAFVEKEPRVTSAKVIDSSAVQLLYQNLQRKIDEYATVQVRSRLEMPNHAPGEIVEAEVRFDAIQPDRWVREITASRPVDDLNPSSKWKVGPIEGKLVDGSHYRFVQHKGRLVIDTDLSDADEGLKPYIDRKKTEVADQFANPLMDFLYGISFEDRFLEKVRSEVIDTEEGKETRVLFRMNGEMARQMKAGGRLLPFFDLCPSCVWEVSYREDVFDTESGDLKRTTYLKADESPFIVQRYNRVVWDEDIPDNQFELTLPVPTITHDFNRVLKHKIKLPTHDEAAKQMEEGKVDWDTLVKRAADY